MKKQFTQTVPARRREETRWARERFSVKSMDDPVTGQQLDGISGHVYYFWPGTTSVRNTALIALGQSTLVTSDVALARAVAK